ncbi:uncharacterized protein LOC128953208 [Oppia nitens]|uniref:uncharacterized protein LOC128953208 n=1 Tax=Oppia nitens TaxID=1686743 RepID=UPI0023DA108E|nr:uncharacterized protein LOC128953208 [Oppia nitens]
MYFTILTVLLLLLNCTWSIHGDDTNDNYNKFVQTFCMPNKTDTQTVRKVNQCSDESYKLLDEKHQKFFDKLKTFCRECVTGKDSEVKGYTLVDMSDTRVKSTLIRYCWPSYVDCYVQKYKSLSDDDKKLAKDINNNNANDKFKECVNQVVKI